MRRCLLVSLVLLAGCAHAPPTGPVVTPDPQRLAADLCTPPSPQPARPPGAGVVRPATVDEQLALATFLNWVATLMDHDTDLGGRAARTAASPACGTNEPLSGVY